MNFKPLLHLTLLLLLLASCGTKSLPEIIEGKWKVTEIEMPDVDIAISIIESAKQEALSSTYHFMPDGKFEIISGLIPKGAKGEWKLHEEKGEIFIKYYALETEFPSTYQIKMVDESTITFEQKLGGDLGTMKMTLKKQ